MNIIVLNSTTFVTTKSTTSGAMSESSSPEAIQWPTRRTMTRHVVDSMLKSTSFSSELRSDISKVWLVDQQGEPTDHVCGGLFPHNCSNIYI